MSSLDDELNDISIDSGDSINTLDLLSNYSTKGDENEPKTEKPAAMKQPDEV